jgi:hypothetical protein
MTDQTTRRTKTLDPEILKRIDAAREASSASVVDHELFMCSVISLRWIASCIRDGAPPSHDLVASLHRLILDTRQGAVWGIERRARRRAITGDSRNAEPDNAGGPR